MNRLHNFALDVVIGVLLALMCAGIAFSILLAPFGNPYAPVLLRRRRLR